MSAGTPTGEYPKGHPHTITSCTVPHKSFAPLLICCHTGLTAAATSDIFPTTIKTVMAGGERLSKGTIQALAAKGVTKVVNAYGPTETVIESLTWTQLIDSKTQVPESGIPVGLPILNNVAYGIKVDPSGTDRDLNALADLTQSSVSVEINNWHKNRKSAQRSLHFVLIHCI